MHNQTTDRRAASIRSFLRKELLTMRGRLHAAFTPAEIDAEIERRDDLQAKAADSLRYPHLNHS